MIVVVVIVRLTLIICTSYCWGARLCCSGYGDANARHDHKGDGLAFGRIRSILSYNAKILP